MTLTDACFLIADCPHTTARDEGEGYPLVRTPNVGFGRLEYEGMHRVSKAVYDCRNKRAVPQPGDLIYAREAPAGNVAVIEPGEEVCLGQRTVLLRPNLNIVDPYYLAYYLLMPEHRNELVGRASGATVLHVNLADIRSLKVAFPRLDVQKRIATVVNDYYAAIANCRKQIALLEEAAMRLYREWFADGKGEKMPLRDFIYFQEGPGIRNWQYVDADGVRFINIRCISNGDVDVSGASMISKEEAFGKYNHFQLREDDIVMSCSGTLGRSAVIRQDHLPLCLNTSVIRFRPKLDARDYPYVYCYLNSDDFLNAQKSMANGAAQLNFGPKHLNLMELTLPQEEMRYKFNEVVMPVLKEKKILYSQIRALTEARDRLLPKLMSGEVAV